MSEHSNNLIILKLALLQVFYALYRPVNAKKNCFVRQIKSNLYSTRGITPKCVTSGGAHLRGLAPGLHSSEETS